MENLLVKLTINNINIYKIWKCIYNKNILKVEDFPYEGIYRIFQRSYNK